MSDRDPIADLLGDESAEDGLIPDVDVPEPTGEASEADPAVIGLFWRLVVVFNVALFGVAVGPMFLYFQESATVGGGLLAIGILTGGYGVFRYQRFKSERINDR